MKRNILILCAISLLASCSASTQRSLQASVYADKTYKCTGGNMVFRLEGASHYKKGYIRVNDSDRVATLYQDSGVDSRWYWGSYVNNNSTVFDNVKHRYKVVVEASGEGIYLNAEKDSKVELTCSELND